MTVSAYSAPRGNGAKALPPGRFRFPSVPRRAGKGLRLPPRKGDPGRANLNLKGSAMITGRIVNIQHFCIHDGPGIRTTVFFKGCPLRCLWCSNPNMQRPGPELVYAKARCVGCGACVRACPRRCLEPTPEGIAVDRARCSLCGACAAACPSKAMHFEGRDVPLEEVMDEISRDRAFYRNSGGGVTLSGGEALAQKAFAVALLAACKDIGIHTGLETTACAPYGDLLEAAALVDHLFIDVKHLSDARHKAVTGVGNALILDNVRRIQAEHPNVHIRIPLVPSVNDTEADLEALARFLDPLSGVRDVEILQYHDLGVPKYAQTGRPYPLEGVEKYDLARLQALLGFFRERCPSRKVLCHAS